MAFDTWQYSDNGHTVSPELQWKIDRIYEQHLLAPESQYLIRCLCPWDKVVIWESCRCYQYETPDSGTIVSNDGKTVVIKSFLFNNIFDMGSDEIPFSVETACSQILHDHEDGPFFYEFTIPKPFIPNFIDISVHELARTDHWHTLLMNALRWRQ